MLAPYVPFDQGAPALLTPMVYGGSPGKPLQMLLNATGARPMLFSAENLPAALHLDAQRGILSGTPAEGETLIRLKAQNALGSDEKTCLLRIAPDGAGRTPVMGWCSWNAHLGHVTQKDVERAADLLVSTGLSAYGYRFVNTDSGWQGAYGKESRAIEPNEKFPDMRAMCEHIHSLGLKAGIYSTPMQLAWGGGLLPGCTRGRLDPKYATTYFGIGTEHMEKENAAQWDAWGMDYLKYDWDPCDVENANLMKQCLLAAHRDIQFCVTVHAGMKDAAYWAENCCSWRDNSDSRDTWENIVANRFSTDRWAAFTRPGHYFDMDMMEIGVMRDHATGESRPCLLTEDEQQVAFSIRVIFPSPLQLSCDLSKLTAHDLALLCNPEVIAVHQDPLGIGAQCVSNVVEKDAKGEEIRNTKVYLRPLFDGSLALAMFNLSSAEQKIEYALDGRYAVRDLWMRRDGGMIEGRMAERLPAHSVKLFRLTPQA